MDFVTGIPPELSLHIFSFLDTPTLCRASCVNRLWKELSEDDILWYNLVEERQLEYSRSPVVLGGFSDAFNSPWKRMYTYISCWGMHNKELLPRGSKEYKEALQELCVLAARYFDVVTMKYCLSLATMDRTVSWFREVVTLGLDETIRWFLKEKNYCKHVRRNRTEFCLIAVTHERISTLRLLMENNFLISPDAMAEACRNGDLDTMKWLHEVHVPFSFQVAKMVGKSGKLEILTWLHENGCPWNSDTTRGIGSRGHLEMLHYAHENGCSWGSDCARFAAQNGHIDCLMYAIENNCPIDATVITGAAAGGQFECILWLRDHGAPWTSSSLVCAVDNGDEHIVRWMLENGCPKSATAITSAARHDRLNLIQLLLEHNCPASSQALSRAAEKGNVEAVRLLGDYVLKKRIRANAALSCAAKVGQLETFVTMREMGIPWDFSTTLTIVEKDQFEILEWGLEHGIPLNTSVFLRAVSHKCWRVLSLLEKTEMYHKVKFQMLETMARGSTFEALEWYHLHGGDLRKPAIALKLSRPVVFDRWVRANYPIHASLAALFAGQLKLSLLERCRNLGCFFDDSVMIAAIECGIISMPVIKFLQQCGLGVSHAGFLAAIKSGSIELVQWALNEGGKLTQECAAAAARARRSDVVQFLIAEGCPVDGSVMTAAAQGGSVAIMEMIEGLSGIYANEDTLVAAVTGNYLDCVVHIIEVTGMDVPEIAIRKALKRNNLGILEYFIEKQPGFVNEQFLLDAIRSNDGRVLLWGLDRMNNDAFTRRVYESCCRSRKFASYVARREKPPSSRTSSIAYQRLFTTFIRILM